MTVALVEERWGVRVGADELAAALAARGLAGDAPHAADVGLAIALAAGDRAALDAFERTIVPDVRGALEKLERGRELVEDALQQVREKLLVGDARIAEYRGRGSLAAWVQVIAIREALMIRRRVQRERPLGEETLLFAVETDPVIALAKKTHREAFAAAFRAALAALDTRDRTLLRLCFVDSTGTERLAALYGVHRVTMFRWLSDARAKLLDGMRAELADRAGISPSEISSLVRALASSLDVGW